MTVRRLRADETALLKSLRLRSLAESPDPAARGRGVGRALGDAVIAWARERGFVRIVLWVTDGNDEAIALYERLGFARTGRLDRLRSNPSLAVFEMTLALVPQPRAS